MAGDAAVVKVIHSPPTRLDKYSGIRVTSGRCQDVSDRKACHQCRQKNRDFGAACTNQKNFKPCTVVLCQRCLLNRYGEKAEEIAVSQNWSCPKCRGICNCSVCMKKQGNTPTGQLVKTAKAIGFSSVSDMLIKGAEFSTNKVLVGMGFSPAKACVLARGNYVEITSNGKADDITLKDPQKNSKDGNAVLNAKLKNIVSSEIVKQVTCKKTVKKKDLQDIHDNHSQLDPRFNDENFTRVRKEKHPKMKRSESEKASVHKKARFSKNDSSVNMGDNKKASGYHKVDATANVIKEDHSDAGFSLGESADIHMPLGDKMTTIFGIDVRVEDVGNALQFLEFCFVFGKVLNLRKGQAENVFRDLLHGRFSRHGRYSVVEQFIVHILSFIQAEQEQESKEKNRSTGRVSWFKAAKEILIKSQGSSKTQDLDVLENAAYFGTLDVSFKLKVLNLLCDEVLKTKMTRNWIHQQNRQLAEKMRETKRELVAARDKEMTLKKKFRDDTAEAVIALKCALLSKSKQDLVIDDISFEVKEAHAEVIKLKTKLMQFDETHDAVRIKPIIRDKSGGVYWKPNCLGKSTIVHQEIRSDDLLALDDKWFVLGDDEKEAVEEYVSLRKKKGLALPKLAAIDSAIRNN